MTFEDQVVLVTGGGSGLGEATARLLAERGARVGVLGRTRSELEAVADGIGEAGGEAMPLVADITDDEALQAALSDLVGRWGRLDGLFANAGVNGVWAPIDELSREDFESTIAINLTGTFLTVKRVVPHLAERGGAIVVTSSVNGTRMFSNSGATAYAASKAAQVAMTKMLALELAKDRIRVNVICPGAIRSEIDENTERRDLEAAREPVEYPEGEIPLTDGRPGRARDVAELVSFLLSPAAGHISGSEVWIDGAQSLLQG